ncbi:MAG: hypothetical protein U0790_17080 [Isosphaeraceae bacterium]
MRRPSPTHTKPPLLAAIGLLQVAFLVLMPSPGDASDEPAGGAEFLERPGSPRLEGSLARDVSGGLKFVPRADPSRPVTLEPGHSVVFPAPQLPSTVIPPLFQAQVGESARISGALRGLSPTTLSLSVPWQDGDVQLARPGVQALLQRPGEAALFADPFEELDASRWAAEGKAQVVSGPGEPGSRRCLRLGAEGASIVHRLAEPLGSGRLEFAFYDDARVCRGRRWTLELSFRGAEGEATVRVLLGWEEESLAVESPDGPSLAVQRLSRTEGWHRLSFRFGPKQTEIAVDGKELAHGKGPSGPLQTLGIFTRATGAAAAAPGLAGRVGEVQLVQFAEPPASVEIDPTQDEVRLVVGDQLFGRIERADPGRVLIGLAGKQVEIRWSEVSGLYFRREPVPSRPVEGPWVRAEWRPSPGEASRDFDFAEGVVTALSPSSLTLETPYSGTLTIPTARLTRLRALDVAWRQVLDPSAHHLGDEIKTSSVTLDPPVPEGGVLERSFALDRVPAAPLSLVLDVIDVVGETGSPFSNLIQKGEIRTFVALNGKRIDTLNHYISSANETSERIRIPLPANLLQAGRNVIRIEQTGTADDPTAFDDLEILQVAIQRPAATGTGAKPVGPAP